MGVELVTVLPNPLGNNIDRLHGLEWRLEELCPSLQLFPCSCLRRVVYWFETYTRVGEMKAEGLSDRQITDYVWERKRQLPQTDEEMSPEERAALERRSWWWEGDGWFDDLETWSLNMRFGLSLEFLPHICFIIFQEKVWLEDHDFCERHLNLSRELARALGAEEFLIVFDSAAPSSAVYGDFPREDFQYQKNWLMENIGPPKNSLSEMHVDYEDYYEYEGHAAAG